MTYETLYGHKCMTFFVLVRNKKNGYSDMKSLEKKGNKRQIKSCSESINELY